MCILWRPHKTRSVFVSEKMRIHHMQFYTTSARAHAAGYDRMQILWTQTYREQVFVWTFDGSENSMAF